MRRLEPYALYVDIGQRIAGKLTCDLCGEERACPPQEVAEYLRTGWPTHCGETMSLVREEKRNGEKAKR